MMAKGLTEPVTHESTFTFNFPDCAKLPPPVLPFINVSFAYSGKKEDFLYQVWRRRRTVTQSTRALTYEDLFLIGT